MGYRIDIYNEDKTINYYGTKHYGYSGVTSGELKKIPSFQYLIKIGKFKKDEWYVFDYSCDNNIVLTAEQFKHFIKLYAKEVGEFQNGKTLLDEPDMIKLLNDKTKKYIGWM